MADGVFGGGCLNSTGLLKNWGQKQLAHSYMPFYVIQVCFIS